MDAAPETPDVTALRTRALDMLGLIDVPPDGEFDALASLAARLLACPMGLVSLIDAERLWPAASAGFASAPVVRGGCFCNVTIAQDAPLFVADATADPRFADSPFVRTGGLMIRGYAGIAITAPNPDGGARVPVGAVCAFDTVPRAFAAADAEMLAELKRIAEALFDARALRRQAEKQAETLRRNDRTFRQAERLAAIGSWRLDLDDETLRWSDGVYRIYELPVGSAPPLQGALDFFPEHARATVSSALTTTIETGAPFDIEIDFITARSSKRRVRSMGELELREGRPCAVVGVFQDITERHAIEESLRRSANVDELTRIANRAAFNVELENRVAEAVQTGAPLALVLLDGDRFKAINDSYGHLAGDDVLRVFGRRLRQAASGHGFAARLGGDEFGLVLTGPAARQVEKVAARLLTDMAMPIHTGAGVIQVSATIGHARFDASDDGVRAFFHRADSALYEAKRAGRGTARGWGALRGADRRVA